jgi:hypothetical protein
VRRRAFAEFADKWIATRTVVDDVCVAEAGVEDCLASDAVERAVDRLDGVLQRRLRARLEIRLVDLDDVGSGRLEVPQFPIDGLGVGEREAPLVAVVVVLWAWCVIVNGPGTVILIRRSVIERRNSTSRTSTGRVRRIAPTTFGTGVSCPVRSRATPGSSRSTPSSAVAKRFE